MTLHVLGYDSCRGDVPLLTVSSGGQPWKLPLAGKFAWGVSKLRTCIGSWHEEAHVACPTRAPVGGDLQCSRCNPMATPECIFEPLCRDGRPCACAEFKKIQHIVYIAFYGTLPKVGITTAGRFKGRLQEQGADAAFIAMDAVDGHPLSRGDARRYEQEISKLHRVPEFRRGREVLSAMTRPVPWDAIEERAEAWHLRIRQHFAGPALHLERFQRYPLSGPLPSTPGIGQVEGQHQGVWLGGKGRYVVYQAPSRGALKVGRPPLVALRGWDLVGRTIAGAEQPEEAQPES